MEGFVIEALLLLLLTNIKESIAYNTSYPSCIPFETPLWHQNLTPKLKNH